MKASGFVKGVMTIGAVGAAAGLAYAAMSPKQHKKLEKSLKKTTDQLSDIMDTLQDNVF